MPGPSSPPPAVGLTVAAVARRLGVAPATLRTWARRYDLGPTAHVAGAHRRYTPSDVARLEQMRRMVQAGIPPADAARTIAEGTQDSVIGLIGTAVTTAPRSNPDGAAHADPRSERAEPVDQHADHDRGAPDRSVIKAVSHDASPALPRHVPGRVHLDAAEELEPFVDLGFDADSRSDWAGGGGGGQVVPMPGSSPLARGLARAAMSLDPVACSDIVRDSVATRGVVWTWDCLLLPVLVGIGRRWERTGLGVDVEHLLSNAVVSVLSAVSMNLRTSVNPRPVLLAGAPDELHSLPLFALAAALSERHVSTRVLGARVPREALTAAVRRIGPSAVVLWAQRYETADPTLLEGVPGMRPSPLVVAAGPGWPDDLPDGTMLVRDLTEAVTRISASVAG